MLYIRPVRITRHTADAAIWWSTRIHGWKIAYIHNFARTTYTVYCTALFTVLQVINFPN